MKRRKKNFNEWTSKLDILLQSAALFGVNDLEEVSSDTHSYLKTFFDRGYSPDELIEAMRKDGVI